MKRMILMTLALVLIAIPAFGQGGYLGLFSNTIGDNCTIESNVVNEFVYVYVVHMDTPGATASEFAVDSTGAPSLLYLADETVLGIPLGNSQTGVGIGYGACLSSPIHILTLKYLAIGISSACSTLRIVEHSNGELRAVDCSGNFMQLDGRGLFINPNETCNDCAGVPVATEIDTWGSLKSLYR